MWHFQGLVVMSGELEAAYRSISMAKVPELWARVSYPSLKPLPSYLEDLYARLAMLQVSCYAELLCQRLLLLPHGFMRLLHPHQLACTGM